MHPFTLERPRNLTAALALRAQAGRNDAPAEYIAGGTDMVQLLQEYVRQPGRLVSLAGLLDNGVDFGPRGLRLGAAATMADVAAHPDNALRERVSSGFDASTSFVATQRTGAISRMTDLGLVDRRRDGVRVTYVMTKQGRKFSPNGESRE